MRVVVSGSTGFVGSAVVAYLRAAGHEVIRLQRPRSRPIPGPTVRWDPEQGAVDPEVLVSADGVVNLAGAPIAGRRWSRAYRAELRSSRIRATRTLVEAMRTMGGPRVLLNASAVGIYGDRGEEELDESCSPGTGFLADLARDWEEEALRAGDRGVRVVLLRFGMVLGPGGALARMLPIFRLGLGGRLGSGRQWVAWVSRADAARAVVHALERTELEGPVNVVAPHPVRQRELARILGRVLRRPAGVPAPAPLLRLALGAMARELLLSGQRAVPARLEASGFSWRHPELAAALREAVTDADRRSDPPRPSSP